ncbi:MAG: cytochrome c peroxidase [Methylomonas sp.]|jgi:cytochrome c peroxidase
MRQVLLSVCGFAVLAACNPAFGSPESQPGTSPASSDYQLLGLPPLPIPANNPQTPAKIALGNKLFHDKRFSIDGTVSCSKCHDDKKAFTDNLPVSVGNHGLTGTRNAPTVINAAFSKFQFWDGREPDLESQAKGPFINPVEAGLPNNEPILALVRGDPEYSAAFAEVFHVSGGQLTMEHVTKAIASFERTIIAGNSPFDRFYFHGEQAAMTERQQRGFQLFLGQGRCVSCHTIEQDQALFSDGRFHNIGVGINAIQADIPRLAQAFLEANAKGGDVDKLVLTDKKTSELGRFAVSRVFNDLGAFKTPTLRNVALTAPYMHDGSLKTLKEVIVHYNNGGVTPATAQVNAFLSGGIRPLNLLDNQIDDLAAFLEALTSAQYAQASAAGATSGDKHE